MEPFDYVLSTHFIFSSFKEPRMKKNMTSRIVFTVVLLPIVLLAGCATSSRRLYPDVPLEQSATLIVKANNYIRAIDGKNLGNWGAGELFFNFTMIIPEGQHVIEWDNVSTRQRPITAVFEAGRKYYLDDTGTITDRGPQKNKIAKAKKEAPVSEPSPPPPPASGSSRAAASMAEALRSIPEPVAPPPEPVAPPPAPPNPYFGGDGGKGISLAILVPEGKNLTAAEAYLPTLVQGVFVTDLSKYSAISVLDRQNLEKVLREAESGIYKSGADFVQLGEITKTGYALTGALTKTAAGFTLQVQIVDTARDGSAVASYSGSCSAQELENFRGIRKASLDLLTQMGVELTAKGKEELTGAGAQQTINAETALAKGITAQKSGTEVQTLAYYYQAAAIDPSLAEAVSRVSVMAANITSENSGTIGAKVRNDFAWRDAWVARLTETENFFRNYIKTPPPYDLVYSTYIRQGAVNYNNRTVAVSFGIELIPASMEWFDTMAKVLKTVQAGLTATGRAEAWGFFVKLRTGEHWGSNRWPGKTVSPGASPFTNQNKTFTIVAELVNEDGATIGRQNIALAYGWTFSFPDELHPDKTIGITPEPPVSETVSFPAVKADLITEKLTIRIVSVDGVAAETASKDGHIMIATKADYDRSPHGIAARKANQILAWYGFSGGTITYYKGNETNIIIPRTLNNGDPVTALKAFGPGPFAYKELTSVTIPNTVILIGYYCFADNNLTNITIPDSVVTIEDCAFQNNKLTSVTIGNSVTSIGVSAFANNELTSVTIGNSVTSIGGGAFANNKLTSVTIGNSVTSIGASAFISGAFANNKLTSVTIGNSVTSIGSNAFNDNPLTSVTIPANVSLSNFSFPNGFVDYYDKNGKKAGTYTYDGSRWSYKGR
jgi:TolB-like protein